MPRQTIKNKITLQMLCYQHNNISSLLLAINLMETKQELSTVLYAYPLNDQADNQPLTFETRLLPASNRT